MTQALEDRFMPKVVWNGEPDECWTWEGSKNPRGYGNFRHGSRTRSAHRVAYELFVGPIPEELEIDHLCSNRACVNAEHLEAVTHGENVRRGRSADSNRERKEARTHCSNGHAYDADNLYVFRDKRYCRACRRAADARRPARNGAGRGVKR